MNLYFKKYYSLILCIAAFICTLLAASNPLAQEKLQYSKYEHQMNDREEFQFNAPTSSKVSSNEDRIIHLHADELNFEAHVDFPSSVLTKPDKYAESITHDNNGALDITLIDQGNTIKYLFQVSSIPKQQCQSDATRACQQGAAVPARGNVAEIQITLQGSELKPGTYTFGKGGSTPVEDVMIYSRQLYSDPSHGKLGCQAWGAGVLNIKRAVYNGNGKLESVEANLFRVCDRTSPFPLIRPEDNLPQVDVENIEKYTYHASWRCHLEVAGEELG